MATRIVALAVAAHPIVAAVTVLYGEQKTALAKLRALPQTTMRPLYSHDSKLSQTRNVGVDRVVSSL